MFVDTLISSEADIQGLWTSIELLINICGQKQVFNLYLWTLFDS